MTDKIETIEIYGNYTEDDVIIAEAMLRKRAASRGLRPEKTSEADWFGSTPNRKLERIHGIEYKLVPIDG